MCLIAYSPKGAMVNRSILAYAHHQNPDGIGVMSAYGVEKFMGHKALKRLRRYLETYLIPAEVPHAIHFRWATHGDIKMSNTHPYETPAGTHWVMHNGVLSCTTAESSADESDTAVYVRKFMSDAPAFDDEQYWDQVGRHIGWGNKFCVMDANGEFRICNDDAGEWIDGIWFSNTYSLPPPIVAVRGGGHGSNYGTWSPKSATYTKPLLPYKSHYGYTDSDGTWTPKETWDHTTMKHVPNPAYKASEHYPEAQTAEYADVVYSKDTAGSTVTRIVTASTADARWDAEDRRAYYETLEAGLTPEDAEYHDIGTRAAVAAELEQTQELSGLPYVIDKPNADIGGDFADPADDEEQNSFRKYLAAVARGIHV